MSPVLWLFLTGIIFISPGWDEQAPVSTELSRWYATDPLDGDLMAVAQDDFHTNWQVHLVAGQVRVDLDELVPDVGSDLPAAIKADLRKAHGRGWIAGVQVIDGWIVTHNRGEFGGELWWFSLDGAERRLIALQNVNQFLKTSLGWVVLVGCSHGLDEPGTLCRLTREGLGSWSSQPIITLPHVPHAAATQAGQSLLVVTNKALWHVDLATHCADVLVEQAFWDGLYPNSIVVDEKGKIFVGMRHGVASLEKVGTAYKTRWLLPNQKVAEQKHVPGLK